jgi:putative RNA 2'-phosphotransferase
MFKDEKDKTRLSKLLSLILRHEPAKIGLAELEPGGYVPVAALLAGLERLGLAATRADLDIVVAESDKQRFSYDETGTRIRCNQGHSVPVDLQLSPAIPPAILYHGTPEKSVETIRQEGLQKMARHAVHLSPDVPTATAVGSRRGRPVILRIDAARMHADGHVFYRSANGVWLVDGVPPDYIKTT